MSIVRCTSTEPTDRIILITTHTPSRSLRPNTGRRTTPSSPMESRQMEASRGAESASLGMNLQFPFPTLKVVTQQQLGLRKCVVTPPATRREGSKLATVSLPSKSHTGPEKNESWRVQTQDRSTHIPTVRPPARAGIDPRLRTTEARCVVPRDSPKLFPAQKTFQDFSGNGTT